MYMKKQQIEETEQLFEEEQPLIIHGRIVSVNHIASDNGESSAFLSQNPTTDEIRAKFFKQGMYNSDNGREIDDSKYDAERLLRSTTITMYETDKLRNMDKDMTAALENQ